ncbi:hypothetical protein, partial [Yoonia sp. R2-816]|uniref:hypothetical protein n=1 Tax=Yoonia sp. R2-816 TaxID=3342638 RepID=UPI0037280953
YVGMGADLALHFNCARSPWDFAADYDFLGTAKLHEIAFPASAYDDDTRQAQSLSWPAFREEPASGKQRPEVTISRPADRLHSSH